MDKIPPRVGALVAERQLGRLVVGREGTSTRSGSVGFLLAGIVAFGLGWVLLWVATETDSRRLGTVALVWIVALAPVLVIFAVRIFARGTQAYYLYEGGLVYVKSGKPRLVRWTDIRELRRLRLGAKAAQLAQGGPVGHLVTADTVTGYQVRPAGGGGFTIRVGGVQEPDYHTFCGYIEQAAAHSGARLTA